MKNFYINKVKQIIISYCLLGLFLSVNIYAQNWNHLTPPGTPEARQGHSMVTMPDGRVILFGGEDEQGTLFNDIYAFSDNSWAKLTPTNDPPPPRMDHESWVVGDKMYCFGGKGDQGLLDDLWVYDNSAWTEKTITGPKPSPRKGHIAKTLTDGSVLILGGTDANGNPLKDFWKLNPDNTFIQLTDAPRAYTEASAELVANGQAMLVFGVPDLVSIYQFSSDMWGIVSGGPPISGYALTDQATNANGDALIYIFGGKDANGNENTDVYEYNINTGQTTIRGDMPQAIVNGASAKLKALPPSKANKKNISSSSVSSFDETLLIFGGLTNGVPNNNTYSFSTQTAPDTVTIIATADTIMTDSVKLTWYSVSPTQAIYYEAQIALDSAGTNVFADTVLTDTTVTIAGLNPQVNYWWHVRAYNAGGWGNYGISLHFYTDFISGIELNGKSIPKDFKLYQNYPNPFNPTTTIKYSINSVIAHRVLRTRSPDAGGATKQSHASSKNQQIASVAPTSSGLPRNDVVNVTLKVYDILGREVATLVNEKQAPGNYLVKFDASKLSSGIYFYRLQAGEFIQTQKMMLLR